MLPISAFATFIHRRIGGLEDSTSECNSRFFVHRCLGGLEVRSSRQKLCHGVHRREGGLEANMTMAIRPMSVHRCAGGLEVFMKQNSGWFNFSPLHKRLKRRLRTTGIFTPYSPPYRRFRRCCYPQCPQDCSSLQGRRFRRNGGNATGFMYCSPPRRRFRIFTARSAFRSSSPPHRRFRSDKRHSLL